MSTTSHDDDRTINRGEVSGEGLGRRKRSVNRPGHIDDIVPKRRQPLAEVKTFFFYQPA